ncbi:MAG: hypothetical protein JWQ71_3388 [Pedosphaera sp.]|nr:hypothetical protein [Pedosphaera sp.]
MTSDSIQPRAWPHRQWWGVVVFLFILQVGLIFWLGERERKVLRPIEEGITMFFAPRQMAEIPGFSSPTLFVLANRHGFSGPAWLTVPQMDYDVSDWTGPTNMLELPLKQLGRTFGEFVQSNPAARFEAGARQEPKVETEDFFPGFATDQSKFWLEGELASRPLVSNFALNSWPTNEVLMNSVVQIAVEPDGKVFSVEMLARSGSKEADAYAYNLAKSAQFQPLRKHEIKQQSQSTDLIWGRLVFKWYTVATASTNSVGGTP